jgi:predicted Zn-dependent peptidase
MNRKTAPSIKDAVDYQLLLKPIEKNVLDNGIEVYSIHAGAQEVIQLELVYFAGNQFEAKKSVAAATNFLLKNGTTKRTALEINETFEYYGGYCNRACYNETATITLHSLTKHLDKLLPVIQDMVSDSVFPENELAIYKQNSKQRLSVNLQKCEFVANRLIDSYIYGKDHPYGKYTEAMDIDSIDVEDCRSFYREQYLNGRPVIFISGYLPVDHIKLLNDHFGGLSVKKEKILLEAITQHPAAERKFRIENDPNGVQGAIRIASPFPSRKHPDFKRVRVLNTLFGGYFGSRLMSNIREEKGYTYGIYSYIQNHIHETAWMISTEAGRDVAESAIQEVYLEMKKLREELVDEDELMLVRNYLIGGILGELDGPFQIMAKWKNIILNNMDENYFYDSVNIIKTITAEEVRTLAETYFNPEQFCELVVY